MTRAEVEFLVLQELGAIPSTARFDRANQQIVNAEGAPITPDQFLVEVPQDELDSLTDDKIAELEQQAAKAAGADPQPTPAASGDVIADVEAAIENPTETASDVETGPTDEAILGGASVQDYLPGRASVDSFFAQGDPGIRIAAAYEQNAEGFPEDSTQGDPFLRQPDARADATPGSGANWRQGEEAFQPTPTRVPTEFYEQLNGEQRSMLPLVFEAAAEHGIPAALLFGLLWSESRLNPSISSGYNTNGTRDHGIAQINESTLSGMGKTIAWAKDPANAIDYAAERLAGSIAKYGSTTAALVEYNGGAGRADEYVRTGEWPYATAEQYVSNILTAASSFDPNGVYEVDGGQMSLGGPGSSAAAGFGVSLSDPTSIRKVADEVGVEVLGRKPTKREKRLIVAALHANERMSATAQASAATMSTSTEGGGSLSQYANGQIPMEMLVDIGGGHHLSPDAATSWQQMVAAAAAEGVDITLTDSYRDLATQERLANEKGLYSQGGLAAEPGTSRHGLGTAVDVDKGREWLAANAAKFGWETIAREPWHWQWAGGATTGPTGGSEFVAAGDPRAMIEAQLEQLAPEEAAATSFAQQAAVLLEILGEGNPYLAV